MQCVLSLKYTMSFQVLATGQQQTNDLNIKALAGFPRSFSLEYGELSNL